MMTTIDIRDLPARLEGVLAVAASGGEVILTDGADPRARIVPCDAPHPRAAGLHAGAFQVPPDVDAPLPDDFSMDQPRGCGIHPPDTRPTRLSSEHQRRCRAELVRDEPTLWLVAVYAVCFLAGSAAIDLWDRSTGDATPDRLRYLIPIASALPAWTLLRAWARRVLTNHSIGVGPAVEPATDRPLAGDDRRSIGCMP